MTKFQRSTLTLLLPYLILSTLAAGCSSTNSNQATADRGRNTASLDGQTQPQATSFVAIAKNCAIAPPAQSAPTTTNASGKEVKVPMYKIYTSKQALPELWAEARKWAPDAKLRNGYSGDGSAFTPTDVKNRSHASATRGAMWAWSATFYSPSKKQEIYLAYIDGKAGGSIPQNVNPQIFEQDEQKPSSIYTDADDMIDSCQLYEQVKAQGFDEKANYYIISTGNNKSTKNFPNRKTWVVEELSRTDNDAGKELLGKVVRSYLFDAITGEFLSKVDGRTYSF